jgi:hypothetical protein
LDSFGLLILIGWVLAYFWFGASQQFSGLILMDEAICFVWLVCVCYVWKLRNNVIFRHKACDVNSVLENIKLMSWC